MTSTSVLTNIHAALNSRLNQLAEIPDVQWPNVDYMPTEGRLFLRPTLMPAAGKLHTIAGSYLHIGMYQVDIFSPLDEGIQALTNWQDAIFNLFSSDKTLISNGVIVFIQDIAQGKGERQEGWYRGYITIYYKCYT